MSDTEQKNSQGNASAAIKLKLINEAREIIRGKRTASRDVLKKLCAELLEYNQFAYATEILLVRMKMDQQEGEAILLRDYQKLVLYIYKDHSLPTAYKLSKALKKLNTHNNLSKTSDCESLGLAGAIYKRKWQFDHQFKNLIISRFYYKKGYERWMEYLTDPVNKPKEQNDDGYTAINFAYINDLMSVDKLEEHGEITGSSQSIDSRLLEAEEVRKMVIKQFIIENKGIPEFNNKGYESWVSATVAEAMFGLRRYEDARIFIDLYVKTLESTPWKIHTFHQQLFSLAYLQLSLLNFHTKLTNNALLNGTTLQRIAKEIDTEEIYKCLALFSLAGNKSENAIRHEIKKSGRTGLALSGGGFRASLFHIGVLAALAERDELKNIEVLSCVSGGSIIGAYYYIKLKALLELKQDKEISKQDYIELVQHIEKDFLEGVQKNLRARIFSNPFRTMKMLFDKNYSRTHRIGELYERFLYSKIWDKDKAKDIFMDDLIINPAGTDNFDIIHENWKRNNKVPQLVLNATSVNTGHNWQFTASWMGEPPGNIQTDIDAKPRLRRMYYKEAPDSYKKFKLGFAVGASSCVPVMFHPMPMFDLYPGVNLQLVDGGLHDNQGIAALIEQECSNMIISDASGQMPEKNEATSNELSVFYRSDTILQERLRELQFMDLKERNYTAALSSLVTVHLKNDLQKEPISWKDCVDLPRKSIYEDLYPEDNELTRYGILKSVQAPLAEIRTDLDAFNNIESYALMYSGYQQMHYEWGRQNKPGDNNKPDEARWKFSCIKEHVTAPAKEREITKILKTGSKLMFKVPSLYKPVFIILALLALGLLVLLGTVVVDNWSASVNFKVKTIVMAAGIFAVGFFFKVLGKLINYKAELRKWIVLISLAFVGFIVWGIYILLFNPLYLRAGKLKEGNQL